MGTRGMPTAKNKFTGMAGYIGYKRHGGVFKESIFFFQAS